MPKDADKYDFFVSYAREDNKAGWVADFMAALVAEHEQFTGGRTLSYFFDKQDIHTFDDWKLSLNDGIAHSRLFLAFVSPHYFASEWCRREWRNWLETEVAKHILSEGAAPIYVVEVPGFVGKLPGLAIQEFFTPDEVARRIAQLCGTADSEGLVAQAGPVIHRMRDRRQVHTDFVQPFGAAALADIRRDDLRRVLARLATELGERAEMVRRAAESQSTVPSYNRFFSGRVDELLALRERLKDDHCGVICGIHGLGGIGKTELAFAYAHAFASVYPGGRFYLPCEGKRSLVEAMPTLTDGMHAFAEFHVLMRDEDRKTPEAHAGAVRAMLDRRLDTHGHVLLVLDNVTDLAMLAADQIAWLTSVGPKLHLLATTRQLPAKGGNWLTLGELSETDALRLLERHRTFANDDERDAAATIARRLGGFALAIELVGAWLAGHEGATYGSALRDFDLDALATLEELGDDADVELVCHNHQKRLTQVLGPVLDELSPEERRTMEYAVFLGPDAVALPWLRELAGADFPKLLDTSRRSDPWIDLTARLIRRALLSRSTEKGGDPRIVRVHRLVQQLVASELTIEDKRICAQAVLSLVGRRDKAMQDPERWEPLRWELEPLEALAWYWSDIENHWCAWMLNQIARIYCVLARWSQAEPLLYRAWGIDEATYGEDHPNVAIRLSNLSQVFRATNRLAESEAFARQALLMLEHHRGEDHPTVADTLLNLSQLLHETNRMAEAEPLIRRALAICEATHGNDHPEVAGALSQLGLVFQKTNRLAEAEQVIRRALAIDEASYGRKHPKVGRDLLNLAHLLQDTNRLAEAEPLLRRALAIDEATYGEDHPEVATNLNNLSQLLMATNRPGDAEALLLRALAINEASYGPDHSTVAVNLNNIGQLLQATNRLAEAEPIMRRALAIDEAVFGSKHPNVARNIGNLAQLFSVTNRVEEAETFARRSLAIYEAALDETHPDVARAINNLAMIFLQRKDRLDEAELLQRRVLDIFERSFGGNHPHVAMALNNLARLLEDTNRLDEAEPLMRRAMLFYTQFRAATGHSHPQAGLVTDNYRILLTAMGKSPEQAQAEIDALAPPP